MDKSVQITLIIVGAVILLVIIGIVYSKSNSTQNTITINGQATTKVSPDLITVYFNIQTKGATLQEASDANTKIANQLTDNIVALGFKESDLQTESFSDNPEYDYSNGMQNLIDYLAINSIKMEIPIAQKSQVGPVVDAGTNAGAGISYIDFELTPALQQAAKRDAIANASIDAEVKAQALASGFNKKLGALVSVSLNEFNYEPWPIYASSASGTAAAPEAKSAAMNINPSIQDVSASVTAVYKLV